MAYWPLPADGFLGTEVGTPSSSMPPFASVVASATPHTKGSWVQLEASTAVAWCGFYLYMDMTRTASNSTSTLLDIGFGAAASEVVQVANYPVGYRAIDQGAAASATLLGDAQWFPLYVPAGTRIAARVQSVVASKAFGTRIIGVTAGGGVRGWQAPADCTTYGADTATSKGVTLTSGASNTYGSWVQLTASTTAQTDAIQIGIQGNGSATVTAGGLSVDIGVGGSGSEQVIFTTYAQSNASEIYFQCSPGILMPWPCYGIPAGSRLAARVAHASATQSIDVVALAYTY